MSRLAICSAHGIITLASSRSPKTPHAQEDGRVPFASRALPSLLASDTGTTYVFLIILFRVNRRLTHNQYIMDGYHVSHDPSKPSTTEPTTGRSLNILDVPSSNSSSGIARPELSIQKRGARTTMATGRSLSPSKIAHPKPSKPYASRGLREADYSRSPDMDDLTSHLEKASLYHGNYSPASSISSGSDISSRGSGGSSPSSLSSLSDPSSGSECRCNRWGITRKGDRVKLDCGGSRCGYSDDSDSSVCSSEASESESEEEEVPVRRPKYQEIAPRRQPVAVQGRRRR